MQVGDLVRHKPAIFNENPRTVHVIRELFAHRKILWVKLCGSSVPHAADMFEVISEVR